MRLPHQASPGATPSSRPPAACPPAKSCHVLGVAPREGQLLGAVLHAQTSQQEVLAAVSGAGRLHKVATLLPPALVGMVGSGWDWLRPLKLFSASLVGMVVAGLASCTRSQACTPSWVWWVARVGLTEGGSAALAVLPIGGSFVALLLNGGNLVGMAGSAMVVTGGSCAPIPLSGLES